MIVCQISLVYCRVLEIMDVWEFMAGYYFFYFVFFYNGIYEVRSMEAKEYQLN